MKATYDGQEVAVKQLNISHTRKASRHLFLCALLAAGRGWRRTHSHARTCRPPRRRRPRSKECKIMLTVRHPNVVRVVGTARRDETLLLLMELCARGDLFHLIQRSRRRRRVKDHFRFVIHVLCVPLPPAAGMGGGEARADPSLRPLDGGSRINIAEGMAHLHSQRVLHRDLKSMNVLLSQSWTAKVSDFGLSRVLLEHSAKTMTRCGSPIWCVWGKWGAVGWGGGGDRMRPPAAQGGTRDSARGALQRAGGRVLFRHHRVRVRGVDHAVSVQDDWAADHAGGEVDGTRAPASADSRSATRSPQAVAFRGVRPIKSAQWPRRLWEMVTQGWEDDASKRPTFKSIVTTLKDMWEEQEQTLKDVI